MPNELPGAGLGSPGSSGGSSGVNGANGDFMSIIGALKTEEMIALACGGAGFLLFIVVIIVIIIRFKKKQQKKKKKSQGLSWSWNFIFFLEFSIWNGHFRLKHIFSIFHSRKRAIFWPKSKF